MIKKNNACCFSGHRILSPKLQETLPQKLDSLIEEMIRDGYTDFITGGAIGFDTAAAQAVLKAKEQSRDIRLILALPCKNQSSNWSRRDKETYDSILAQADEVHYLAEDYDSGCMMRRNKFMVDNSSRCIFYLINTKSGTYKTVSYAMENELELYNILGK